MRYRRAKTEGGRYFFTVNIADRSQQTLVQHVHLLRSVFRIVKERHPFAIDAIVVLPEHLHTIWTLPEGDTDYPTRWALIKAAFSRGVEKQEVISNSRKSKGERGICQRRYWEHAIRDDEDFGRHVDYIHYNPVKHGHVSIPIEWQYTSLHYMVAAGQLPSEWGASAVEVSGYFGE